MARLPLFYDSQFIGNTLTGGPGSTTGAADGPVLGTAHAWADLEGTLWQTQGANYLGGATLETLNPRANTPYGGALSRPVGERCQDQMARITTIPGLSTVWMIYLKFNTAGNVTYYRFRLHFDGRLYIDTVVAPATASAILFNSIVPNWDSSLSYDFEVSATSVNPVAITWALTDNRTNLIVYQSSATDAFSSLHGVSLGGYALGENSNVPGGPFFRVRLYGNVGQGPPYTYDAFAAASVVLTARAHLPPRTWTKDAAAQVILIANCQARLAVAVHKTAAASVVLTARAKAASNAIASIVLTPTAKRVSVGSASIIVSAAASENAAFRESGAATIRLFLLASAVKVIQRIRVSQLPVEVLRSRYTDTDLARPEVSQLCIEVLVPYVHAGTFYAKAASATVIVTAHASNVRPAVSGDADPEVIMTAVAASPGVIRSRSIASASIVLTVTGDSLVGNFGAGIASVRLSALALNFSPIRPTFSFATVVLTARARALASGVDFGGDYLGRFQQGQDVPLLVVVRDQHGSPVDPTLGTPKARIYSLDTMTAVETVDLVHLRYARIGQVYSLPLRLTVSYPVGRYGVLLQAPVDSFAGVSLSIFEVVASGDPAGPVIASYTVAESTGDLVLGQLASGAVVVGQKPGIS